MYETNINVANQWVDGSVAGGIFNAGIENLTGNTVEGWTLTFKADFVISNIWNARVISYENGVYTIGNVIWNGEVANNGTVSFGFQASGNLNSVSNIAVNSGITPSEPPAPIPAPEPTPEPAPQPEPQPEPSGYDVDFLIKDQWGNGANAGAVVDVAVENLTGKDVDGWTLTFKADFDITNIWNAEIISHENGVYTIRNAEWNDEIDNGKEVRFGFQVKGAVGNVSDIHVNESSVTPVPAPQPEPAPEPVPQPQPVPEPTPEPQPQPEPTPEPGPQPEPGTPPFDTDDYSNVLGKSMLFYYAQRSGDLPADNPISWRGDSALQDGSDVGRDLTGGWYDAGDHVKLGFPMAYSATTLAWGGDEFAKGYAEAGAKDELLDNLKWVNDYFLKAYVDKEGVANDVFYGQVGDANKDHSFWGAPENMEMERPSFSIDAQRPGSDLAGETAAAMASSSILFKAHGDTAYAVELLTKAEHLYAFAEAYPGKYSDSITEVRGFYDSSGHKDELAWGAAWLYKATGNEMYLAKAESYYSGGAMEFSWDSKMPGVGIMLAQMTGDNKYINDTISFFNHWMDKDDVPRTPGTETNDGLTWLREWGANRYAANTAFLAEVFGKYLISEGINIPLAQKLIAFASDQIDYMLGDNPTGQSYVVGFGDDYPLFPHHRAASGVTDINDPFPNRHVLEGALVGGPGQNGNYNDERDDYVQNEVAVDYNAGFSGALAGLIEHDDWLL